MGIKEGGTIISTTRVGAVPQKGRYDCREGPVEARASIEMRKY